MSIHTPLPSSGDGTGRHYGHFVNGLAFCFEYEKPLGEPFVLFGELPEHWIHWRARFAATIRGSRVRTLSGSTIGKC